MINVRDLGDVWPVFLHNPPRIDITRFQTRCRYCGPLAVGTSYADAVGRLHGHWSTQHSSEYAELSDQLALFQ